jgi:hypothetical protein
MGYPRRTLVGEVDLHIVAMLVIIVPFALFLPAIWATAILTAVPQGRILTRVFVDYPAFKQPAFRYFIANELLVAGVVALYVIVWRLL